MVTPKNSIEELLNQIFNNFIQEEMHCVIIADILIGRIESAVKHYEDLEKAMGKNHKELRPHSIRVDNLKRLLALSKIAYNSKKKWIDTTFKGDDTYNATFNISKLFDSLFKMDENHIQLLYVAKDMIEKGSYPVYIDLETSKIQELAKRSNLPVEYVRSVLAHLPDIIVNE